MKTMIYISLALNTLVLLPIIVLMFVKAPIVDETWGSFSPARGILMSIYFAILVVSVALLFLPVPALVAALLLVQVIYKVTTPFTVGEISHPVVISNLAIAAFHIATLITIFRASGSQILTIR
jgi:hypothetical protein